MNITYNTAFFVNNAKVVSWKQSNSSIVMFSENRVRYVLSLKEFGEFTATLNETQYAQLCELRIHADAAPVFEDNEQASLVRDNTDLQQRLSSARMMLDEYRGTNDRLRNDLGKTERQVEGLIAQRDEQKKIIQSQRAEYDEMRSEQRIREQQEAQALAFYQQDQRTYEIDGEVYSIPSAVLNYIMRTDGELRTLRKESRKRTHRVYIGSGDGYMVERVVAEQLSNLTKEVQSLRHERDRALEIRSESIDIGGVSYDVQHAVKRYVGELEKTIDEAGKEVSHLRDEVTKLDERLNATGVYTGFDLAKEGADISALCVSGPYRSGGSYVMNWESGKTEDTPEAFLARRNEALTQELNALAQRNLVLIKRLDEQQELYNAKNREWGETVERLSERATRNEQKVRAAKTALGI